MEYNASPERYGDMIYRYCGQSGLLLPVISLGLWQNFGETATYGHSEALVRYAFDNGITHFDIANNYGPPPGYAEETFGRILKNGLMRYRDEILIATKAGYDMWDGPYGSWGSRKHMMASIDCSLRRLGVDYVDIFYSHRPDPETPIEETAYALIDMVRAGKALYIGLSRYSKEQLAAAAVIFRSEHVPFICYQGKYSMLVREPERDILPQVSTEGIGFIAFSPLAQGLLTSRYFDGIPSDSRVTHSKFLTTSDITPEAVERSRQLDKIARRRGQTLAQMAISWLLKDIRVTTVICGASSTEQLKSNLSAIDNMEFDSSELAEIETVLRKK